MKVYSSTLAADQSYQAVVLPNGAAPLGAAEHGTEDGAIELFWVGPDSLLEAQKTTFGVYIVGTGQKLPADLRLFPEQHVLTGTVSQPNARFLASVNGLHIFVGNPRE